MSFSDLLYSSIDRQEKDLASVLMSRKPSTISPLLVFSLGPERIDLGKSPLSVSDSNRCCLFLKGHFKEGDKDVNMKFRSSPDVGMD